jgi:hypothetical protein
MKAKKSVPTRPTAPSTKKGTSPLNLSPEQARREGEKLRELSDDLEDRPTPNDTTVRTSPLGRND